MKPDILIKTSFFFVVVGFAFQPLGFAPEYNSPGVYIEEIESGPKPIEGVSTSTAGTVGVTSRGPTKGKPQLITSFPDFIRQLNGGKPLLTPDGDGVLSGWGPQNEQEANFWSFPLAVKEFFKNGGDKLYIYPNKDQPKDKGKKDSKPSKGDTVSGNFGDDLGVNSGVGTGVDATGIGVFEATSVPGDHHHHHHD